MTEIYYLSILKFNSCSISGSNNTNTTNNNFKEYDKTKVFFMNVYSYTVLLCRILFDKNKNTMICCVLIIN